MGPGEHSFSTDAALLEFSLILHTSTNKDTLSMQSLILKVALQFVAIDVEHASFYELISEEVAIENCTIRVHLNTFTFARFTPLQNFARVTV